VPIVPEVALVADDTELPVVEGASGGLIKAGSRGDQLVRRDMKTNGYGDWWEDGKYVQLTNTACSELGDHSGGSVAAVVAACGWHDKLQVGAQVGDFGGGGDKVGGKGIADEIVLV
jgi:hypothetical protein